MKRAQTVMSVIIIAVLAVLGLLILSWITKTSSDIATTASDITACRESVKQAARAGTMILRGGPLDLACSTSYLKVDSAENTVKKANIAAAMESCWDMFGRGRLDIFDTETANYCIVCSRLEFGDTRPITGLGEYLAVTNRPSTDQTYLSFLRNQDLSQDVRGSYASSSLSQSDTLQANPLAVVFIQAKKVEEHTTQTTVIGASLGVLTTAGALVLAPFTLGGSLAVGAVVIGGVSGGGVGYFIGSQSVSQDSRSAVALWQYDDLDSLSCARIEGRSVPLAFVS